MAARMAEAGDPWADLWMRPLSISQAAARLG
jgi:hypothetical protein